MNQPTPPTENPSPTDPLVKTPIDIARARFASTYGESVVNDPAQVSTLAGQAADDKPRKRRRYAADRELSAKLLALTGSNGCLLAGILTAAFVAGGIMGGVVGGTMLIWFTGDKPALVSSTPTPVPTPTPAPVKQIEPTATSVLPSLPTPSTEDIIASVIPSVVTVINQQHAGVFAAPLPDEGRVVGSGVVIDSRGYIATNNHVVDSPGELSILLADGRAQPAELIAANPAEDLAIVKINVTDLKPIEWGDSGKVRPGQIVYAIGSPLGDFPNSVSFGIVSGLNRALEIDTFVIDGLIQTDAAINRGSSGGPLINLDGKVVGINTFIIRESEERGIAEGIAFSIPAEKAKNLLIPWIAAHTGESVPIPAADQ